MRAREDAAPGKLPSFKLYKHTLKMQDLIAEEIRIGRGVTVDPRVSIVIPAYNVAPFIAETLESVLAQSYRDYEVILVNDGSPDMTELEKNLAGYFDDIVYIKQSNGGPASARNTAIGHSTGKLLAFLDGDDIWLPDYLSNQVGFLDANNLDMVYADALLFGDPSANGDTFMDRSPSTGVADFEGIVSGRCHVVTSGTVVYKHQVVQAGQFDSELPVHSPEDFDMWVRLARANARIGYQTKTLLKYRLRPNSLSGNSIQRAHRCLISLNIIREKFRLNPDEVETIDAKLVEANAALLLEKGKAYLLMENFVEARRSFRAANAFYGSLKLRFIDLSLAWSPKILLLLFKKFRSSELPYIPRSVDI